jgi:hypothetical protein
MIELENYRARKVHIANNGKGNLPRDENGKVKAGPGRPPGRISNFVFTKLAKNEIGKVFELLGGAHGMYNWARSNPKNLTLFYTQIFVKLLSAQSLDAASDKLSRRPSLTKIENVIVDPKNDYHSTVIDGEAEEVPQEERVKQVNGELQSVRQQIAELMHDGGLNEEETEFMLSQMPTE